MAALAGKWRSGALVVLDQGVGRVVVDRFEVFAFDHVGRDAVVTVDGGCYVTHQVLDELRIVVGALGDELFVRALEQAVQLAAGLGFRHVDQVFDPHVGPGGGGDGDVRALVVGTALGNLLRARAQAGDRHQHLHGEAVVAVDDFADESHFVVQQALHAGDRRRLVDEVRKAHFQIARLGFQPLAHFAHDGFKAFHRDLAVVAVEDLDKAGHVRAFEIVRQVHVHVENADSVLDAAGAVGHQHRMADRLDADLVDGNVAGVRLTLDVRHGYGVHLRWISLMKFGVS